MAFTLTGEIVQLRIEERTTHPTTRPANMALPGDGEWIIRQLRLCVQSPFQHFLRCYLLRFRIMISRQWIPEGTPGHRSTH